jgi:hypothetical protein
MIENGIAGLDIAQKIHKRNLIGLRPRERAHDEVEIGGRKSGPTIRPDHRDFIMRDMRAYGKSDHILGSIPQSASDRGATQPAPPPGTGAARPEATVGG